MPTFTRVGSRVNWLATTFRGEAKTVPRLVEPFDNQIPAEWPSAVRVEPRPASC
jgi:hypothetical protein